MEENRLLTDEEMQTIRNELIRYINIGTPFGTQEMCRTIAKAQDTKTASIKDAEFEKKCKECEYDPQAPEEALSKMKPEILSQEEMVIAVNKWKNEDWETRYISLSRGHYEDILPVVAKAQRDADVKYYEALLRNR